MAEFMVFDVPVIRFESMLQDASNVCRCTGMHCVVLCLQQLKRSYWPWPWDVAEAESIKLPARSFLGDFGRAGVNSRTVGVMQVEGRPYGDLELALSACERLAAVSGGLKGSWDAARNVRDQGVLLCHLKQFQEAAGLLAGYVRLLEAGGPQGERPAATMSMERELELLRAVMLKLSQETLDAVFAAS
jgi:hypothetical protein